MITNLQALLWRPHLRVSRPSPAAVRRVLVGAGCTAAVGITVIGVVLAVALASTAPPGTGAAAAVGVVVLTGSVTTAILVVAARVENRDNPRPAGAGEFVPWPGIRPASPPVQDLGEVTAVMDAVREQPAADVAAVQREFTRPVSELAEYRMVDGDVTALMDAVYGGPGRHSVDAPTQALRVVR